MLDARSERTTARPVGDFPTWTFDLACSGCGEHRGVPVTDLIRHYGGRHLVREVVERFSCRRCRAVPASVLLRDGDDCIILRMAMPDRRVVPFPAVRHRAGVPMARQADLLERDDGDPRTRSRRVG